MAELSKDDAFVINKIVTIGLPITAIILVKVWCFRITAPIVTPLRGDLVLAYHVAFVACAFSKEAVWA